MGPCLSLVLVLFVSSIQFDEASDAEKQQKKDYKSDSEIYTEPKSSGHKAKSDVKNVEKYKKIHLDERLVGLTLTQTTNFRPLETERAVQVF